ncbi:hypothetical protein SESBI_50360 [Sesbania bispinosa]|nr:hypothetical protein SESBI_50360 [Sesbania bispinosa]
MCWSTQYYPSHSQVHDDGDPFTITAFFVRLWPSDLELDAYDSLTLLLHLPLNNNNKTVTEIPFPTTTKPAILTLRRMCNTDGHVIFGSKETVHVATTKVLKFQLYAGEAKMLKGAIRKDRDWKLKCFKCELPSAFSSISEVELLVGLDGHVPIRERVIKTRNNNNKHRRNRTNNKLKLEDIPEETELHIDNQGGDAEVNREIEEACVHLEMDLEVLRRSLDMGIWVLCLGLGFMVSKASITRFRSLTKFS